ncbi:hypothetical protein GCM10025865_05470 [Paraoerskovia sediminicola]|uniref:Uncharacterized protein n=2 Tax=Paraoerskovia sediminicola TaxID=1138587 RepID=A0ABM8FZQ3_9CELL|nr:hypothetical protein GCM10025865_05470 [Paraoerskovia sediminicola]
MLDVSLVLPEGWFALPAASARDAGWVEALAGSMAEGAGGAPAGDPESAAEHGDAQEPGRTPEELLADQLRAVVEVVDEVGQTGLRAAVLVRRPQHGVVDALLTFVVHDGVTPEEFVDELRRAPESDDSYLLVEPLESEIPAGTVRGAHLMIGHLDAERGEGVAHLEERVVVGVFPPDSGAMVEVNVVSSSVGTFEDAPAEVLGVLTGLSTVSGRAR